MRTASLDETRTEGLLERARTRLKKRPEIHDALEDFLLPDEHPMLRRSFRSRHFGGALEIQVLRFLGLHGFDPRLKRWWHLSVPLLFVWMFILTVLYFLLEYVWGAASPYQGLYNTYNDRGALAAYRAISGVFAFGSAGLVSILYFLNFVVGAMVMRVLRRKSDISELVLTSISSHEMVQALWMRIMVGARVAEVMAGMNLLNYAIILSLDPSARPVLAVRLPILVLAIFTGAIGARRGALHALAAGLLEGWSFKDDIRFMLRTAALLIIWALLGTIFLPLTVLVAAGLIVADWPLLYYMAGWRDYGRLSALFEPSALEEGIDVAVWRRLWRLPKRS